jgi:hypothetical protein
LHTTIELLLEKGFSTVVYAEGLGGQQEQEYAVGRELPFREDLSTEAEE